MDIFRKHLTKFAILSFDEIRDIFSQPGIEFLNFISRPSDKIDFEKIRKK